MHRWIWDRILRFYCRFTVGNIQFNNVTVVSYSNSYQYFLADFKRYNSFDATSAVERFSFQDNFYSNDVRINAVHNWLINFSDRFQLSSRTCSCNLVKTKRHSAQEQISMQLPNNDRLNYAYHYLSRRIYSGQLEGTHKLGAEENILAQLGVWI